MSAPTLIYPATSSGGTPVGGSGTPGTIPRWTGPSTLGDSGFIDNGTAIYTATRNVGVGMTSGFPAKLGVLSVNAIGTADLTFSYDATGSYRHGFSNVFSSGTAANNTSTWLVWNAAGGQTQVMTANGAGNVGFGTANPTAALDTPASTTTRATLRIRSGVAPTAPNDGDIWFTGATLHIRIAGVTRTFTVV